MNYKKLLWSLGVPAYYLLMVWLSAGTGLLGTGKANPWFGGLCLAVASFGALWVIVILTYAAMCYWEWVHD